MHGNWAAVRGSVYEKCLNPLHRLHRIPAINLPIFFSAIDDAISIANFVFALLESVYPGFVDRIKVYAPVAEDEIKEVKNYEAPKPVKE